MEHKITVYSTDTCHYCKMAKQYLTDKGVKYEVKNVGVDQEAQDYMINISGQMGVPVIEFDKEVIIGFDRARLEQLLNN